MGIVSCGEAVSAATGQGTTNTQANNAAMPIDRSGGFIPNGLPICRAARKRIARHIWMASYCPFGCRMARAIMYVDPDASPIKTSGISSEKILGVCPDSDGRRLASG